MGFSAITVTESSRKTVIRVLRVENIYWTELQVVLCDKSNGEVTLACKSIGLRIWSRNVPNKG